MRAWRRRAHALTISANQSSYLSVAKARSWGGGTARHDFHQMFTMMPQELSLSCDMLVLGVNIKTGL